MQKDISLKLKPSEAADSGTIKNFIAKSLGIPEEKITGFYRSKESIDARSSKQVWINLSLKAFIDEPFIERPIQQIDFREVTNAKKKVVIVAAGPAG